MLGGQFSSSVGRSATIHILSREEKKPAPHISYESEAGRYGVHDGFGWLSGWRWGGKGGGGGGKSKQTNIVPS